MTAPLYYFIVNPKSGSSVDFTCIRQLKTVLIQRQCRVHLELTRSLDHAGVLAGQALAMRAETVIVAGGDGTVRQVADAIAGSKTPILIIPCGTENLLAGVLGLDGTLKNALSTLEHGQIRNLDLGQANDRHFMAIVGVGFDAEVVHRVHSQRTGHITHTTYLWPICRTFWEHRFPHLQVEADGKLLCDEPALVFVSNISRYAIGLGISLKADFSDGWLDLCIYKCNNRLRLLSHALLTVLHRSDNDKLVTRTRCRNVSIRQVGSPSRPTPVQIDGDPGPSLPLNIAVIPAAARVLTPPLMGHS